MAQKYLLGLDIGSSSVKASLVQTETGLSEATAFFPKTEAPMISVRAGWAEQNPQRWWEYMKQSIAQVMAETRASGEDIAAIGLSYQMHGLVCIDKDRNVLRPSIIWCDSRAVPYGEKAFRDLGQEQCLEHLLNSPGNFTAAKLAWVKEHEPQVYSRIHKILLPGDYIAMRLSGEVNTTVCGLSEGMLWDFKENRPARMLLDYFGFAPGLLADIVPTFAIQGEVSPEAAKELGLKAGTPISYRGGDQPNNALSLNVLNPGEIAATAGTSGVVYGILGEVNYDPASRVNLFAHVNHTPEKTRLGVLAICNGTGILNAWMRRNVAPELNYDQLNELAAMAPIGCDGLTILPFGNGAERLLENKEPGCYCCGLHFNRHSRAHMVRAAQEGIVFAFCHGMEIMRQMGMDIRKIHAGRANMFLSSVFADTLASTSGASIELYETDGATGAAKGAGLGCGLYKSPAEAFSTLKQVQVIDPDPARQEACASAYSRWKEQLNIIIK